MEKFYLYLKDKNKLFMKKDELVSYYLEFKSLWGLNKQFSSVFDSLRKTKLTYMFDNYWAISKDNPLKLIVLFMGFLQIPCYYGLDTALFFNKKTWQPILCYQLLNTKISRDRKINNIPIKLIKIPKEIYSKETIIFDNIPYSDYEKTILDMLFKKKQRFYEPENLDKINLYLSLYKSYPEVRAKLINNLSDERRCMIR